MRVARINSYSSRGLFVSVLLYGFNKKNKLVCDAIYHGAAKGYCGTTVHGAAVPFPPEPPTRLSLHPSVGVQTNRGGYSAGGGRGCGTLVLWRHSIWRRNVCGATDSALLQFASTQVSLHIHRWVQKIAGVGASEEKIWGIIAGAHYK